MICTKVLDGGSFIDVLVAMTFLLSICLTFKHSPGHALIRGIKSLCPC